MILLSSPSIGNPDSSIAVLMLPICASVNSFALISSLTFAFFNISIDVFFPTPYGIASTPDPWYPRPRPPLSNDDLSIYRLGAVINPTAFKDDVTNFDINGASQ